MSATFGSDVRSEYEYNGLNWRTVARLDTGPTHDGTLDQERVMYYDQSWRLLEERIDDDFDADPGDGFDRIAQQVWGMRYIDDAVLRRVNENFENDDPNTTYEDKWHDATDALFSVVAVLQARGATPASVHNRREVYS